MTDQLHGAALLKRALAEHRRIVIPIAVVLVLNVVFWAAGVYPLAQRVANIQQRDRQAEQQFASARREHEAARNALTGKERATVELATFYNKVLPADLAGARRLTYLRIEQLARDAGLQLRTSKYGSKAERGSRLDRYQIALELEGSYDAVRSFIYELDTAPEFVVIDDLSLAKRTPESDDLHLSMNLSTYYRVAQP